MTFVDAWTPPLFSALILSLLRPRSCRLYLAASLFSLSLSFFLRGEGTAKLNLFSCYGGEADDRSRGDRPRVRVPASQLAVVTISEGIAEGCGKRRSWMSHVVAVVMEKWLCI